MDFNSATISLDLAGVEILREAHDRATEARRMYEDLVVPIASDIHLDTAWETYLDFMRERGISPEGCRRVHNRQMFLIAVMAIFCPQSLVGGKMNAGMRPRIARMFEIRSETPVSQNAASAIVTYRSYSRFRKDCDALMSRILQSIPMKKINDISRNICIHQNI